MPVDIQENDFYVCLLSNNSIQFYPENTLSAYTNLLKYPLKLTKDWVVGITEISYNCYNVSKPLQNKSKRSVDNILNNDSKPASKKRRSTQPAERYTGFRFKNTTFNYKRDVLYNMANKNFVIDFTSLLSAINTSLTKSHYVVYLKEMYEAIIRRIKQAKEKNDVPYIKYKQDTGEFLVQIELNKTHYVVLKSNKIYNSIENFIEDLIGQINLTAEDYGKLTDTVKTIIEPRNVKENEKESIKFYIDLKDIGATIKIKKPLPPKLTVNEFTSLLIDNLKFDNENLNNDEKQRKIDDMQKQIKTIFKNLQADSMDVEQSESILNPTTIIHIPYEKTGLHSYKTTPVPIVNKFSDLQTF